MILLQKIWKVVLGLVHRISEKLKLTTQKVTNVLKPVRPAEPLWLTIAFGEMGQKEIPGSEHNERILEYHKHTSLTADSDEIPWCSAFICWCFNQVGILPTGSPLARSWLTWGIELEDPKVGCVAIFRRGRASWQGHVGFYLSEDKKYIYLLGGNQRDEVSIIPQSKRKLLDYRWPDELSSSS